MVINDCVRLKINLSDQSSLFYSQTAINLDLSLLAVSFLILHEIFLFKLVPEYPKLIKNDILDFIITFNSERKVKLSVLQFFCCAIAFKQCNYTFVQFIVVIHLRFDLLISVQRKFKFELVISYKTAFVTDLEVDLFSGQIYEFKFRYFFLVLCLKDFYLRMLLQERFFQLYIILWQHIFIWPIRADFVILVV